MLIRYGGLTARLPAISVGLIPELFLEKMTERLPLCESFAGLCQPKACWSELGELRNLECKIDLAGASTQLKIGVKCSAEYAEDDWLKCRHPCRLSFLQDQAQTKPGFRHPSCYDYASSLQRIRPASTAQWQVLELGCKRYCPHRRVPTQCHSLGRHRWHPPCRESR